MRCTHIIQSVLRYDARSGSNFKSLNVKTQNQNHDTFIRPFRPRQNTTPTSNTAKCVCVRVFFRCCLFYALKNQHLNGNEIKSLHVFCNFIYIEMLKVPCDIEVMAVADVQTDTEIVCEKYETETICVEMVLVVC